MLIKLTASLVLGYSAVFVGANSLSFSEGACFVRYQKSDAPYSRGAPPLFFSDWGLSLEAPYLDPETQFSGTQRAMVDEPSHVLSIEQSRFARQDRHPDDLGLKSFVIRKHI